MIEQPTNYHAPRPDEWVAFTPDGVRRVACCDCSLVHRVFTRIVDGRVEQRFERDDERTKELRTDERAAK